MKKILQLVAIITCIGCAHQSARSINSLDQEAITKKEFDQIIDQLRALYEPIAIRQKAKLRIESDWMDMRDEAHAGKNDEDWFVYLAGGIARSPRMTLDGLAFVLCHELGHQFGGYPFVNLPGNVWNTREGQTDYYAAFVCARMLWQNHSYENSKAETTVDPFAKAKCDEAWQSDNDRFLCYRISIAGQTMLNREAENQGLPAPHYSTREILKQATLQCRLDSVLQGATCAASYDRFKIPGYLHPDGINSDGAREEAQRASCDSKYGHKAGLKPTCWWP